VTTFGAGAGSATWAKRHVVSEHVFAEALA
jgi:hypothetical protein